MRGLPKIMNNKNQEIKDAAAALVKRLREIAKDDRYISVWTMYQIHGGKYSGPFYVNELETLERVLANTP